MKSQVLKKIGSQDLTGGVPLSLQTVFTGGFVLEQILLKASEAITETVTVTYISSDGTEYNTVLQITELSADTDFVFRPTGVCVVQAGDQIKIQCTAGNTTGIAYATILGQDLGIQ